LQDEIETEVRAINATWGTDTWTPVVFEKRNLPPIEMMALHRLARFCMVTPLHDGMNLVAKEFVASRYDSDGVLILSRFAGAAQELRTALLVNPYAERELCDAIRLAVTMPRSERQGRMKAARMVLARNDIFDWAGELLEELTSIADARKQPHPITRFGTVAAGVA
jgi:trehalose 6-phosphate synthase